MTSWTDSLRPQDHDNFDEEVESRLQDIHHPSEYNELMEGKNE